MKFLILPFIVILMISVAYFVKAENDNSATENSSLKGKITNSSKSIKNFDIGSKFIFEQEGISSWYGKRFHNRKTASGEIYNMNEYTAAHKSLPFGTIVRVKNLETGKNVIVRINDRGPFVKSRIIDLSYLAASNINAMGVPPVKIEGLDYNQDILNQYNNEDYYFAYSYEFPLACLPESVVKIIGSTNDFSEAVDMYNELALKYPDRFYYLLVPPDYLENRRNPKKATFYLGYFFPDNKSNEQRQIAKSAE